MRTISVLVLGMVLCLGAWAADSTIHGLPNGTAPLPADVTIIDRESPPGTWHNYKLPLSSIATTQVITTNYYTFGTNYYYNDTYVSNFFETNILVDATSSNYFATYNYVTNTYQTNVTIEQYISNNSYVSNYVTTNIFNDTYVSNYFATNLFPTTYVYVTNTIGGAFIANNGGEGTNTVLRGNTVITKAYGDGSGLTNLAGGSQVWTNDGTFTWLSGYPTPDTTGSTPGPPFFLRNDGSLFVGTNVTQDVLVTDPSKYFPIYSLMFVRSNEPTDGSYAFGSLSDENYDYYSYVHGGWSAGESSSTFDLDIEMATTNGLSSALHFGGNTASPQFYMSTNDTSFIYMDVGGIAAPAFFGDGSGLTNLNNVIETNVYQTFNVKNLTVQSNIFYFQSRPQVVAWSGPTNTLDFSQGQVFTYSTLVPVSITNIIGITNGYQNASLLWLTNSSSTNIAITLPTGWKTGRGDATTCTNGGVFQVWPAEAGGMRTIATKEYP